jgi:signal transduction histidine kinase
VHYACFPNAHHRLKKDIQGPVLLNGNDDGLRQILTNLLSNALKYDPQGEISIKLNQDQGYVRLSVSDQGRGLKKEDITRIFEPFQCGTPQEEDKKGTGLGLVIAKRWTEAHGGKIWVESAGPGQGATFHVVLPAG